jgi:hypothetical protein
MFSESALDLVIEFFKAGLVLQMKWHLNSGDGLREFHADGGSDDRIRRLRDYRD